MAQIPIEERDSRGGGSSLWKWLLALVAVGLLVWLVAALVDTGPDEDLAVLEEEGASETLEQQTYEDGEAAVLSGASSDSMNDMTTGPYSNIAALENGTSPQQMQGSDVQLTNVEVTRVLSDGAILVQAAQASNKTSGQMAADTMVADAMGMERDPMRQRSSEMRQEAPMDRTALVVLDESMPSMDAMQEGQRIRLLNGTVMMADAAMMNARDFESDEAMEDGYFIRAERVEMADGSS